MNQDVIKSGDYVIVQRQGYTKLHKVKDHGTVVLGKDNVELDNVIGHRYFETFRMLLRPNNKRLYTVEKVTEQPSISQLSIEQSGFDNRDITDDGTSQVLTVEDIMKFRDDALSSTDIVGRLISNSKTFSSKTEYSQEKYLKKKQKKYFEYIQVRRPSIRLLAQMFYRQDPTKTLGIRVDDLSQILTYANVQAEGNYLLYDSGTSGLVAASIMNTIGANTTGKLLHVHPGNQCQKNAFLAMQFPTEQAERCINVNLYSVLRCYHQNKDSYCDNSVISDDKVLTVNTEDLVTKLDSSERSIDDKSLKRTASEANLDEPSPKKPCWQKDNEAACKVLDQKLDSIIVTSKEHPVNIVKEFVLFLKPGRTIVVFSLLKESLQDLYVYLKSTADFISVKVFSNFMRNYQILPERTHPEVNMNFGGYILIGYKIQS